jgi:CBS domain-containing protein
MFVRDAMVATPLVVDPATSVGEFVRRLLASNQTTAAVVEAGGLVGMVSIEDVFRRLVPSYIAMDAKLAEVVHASYFEEAFVRLERVAVREVMATAVDALEPQDPIMRAVELFVSRRRKTVPVLEGGRFIGSVTRRSVLQVVTRNGKA